MIPDNAETASGRVVPVAALLCLLLLGAAGAWWCFSPGGGLPSEENPTIQQPDRGGTPPPGAAHSCTWRFLESKGVCHDLHIFLIKRAPAESPREYPDPRPAKRHGLNENFLVGVMLALVIVSSLVSLADVLGVRRERERMQSLQEGEVSERCSLAEFANMRTRRESSATPTGIKELGRRVAPLFRFESVGTAFSRMRRESVSNVVGNVTHDTETPTGTSSTSPRLSLKLLGARPTSLSRRSSFPALSLLDGPDQHRRRMSIDSEDDSSPDAVGRRRVRIIRRH